MTFDIREFLTPPEIRRKLRIRQSKVLGWIKNGDLPAIDVSEGRGRRPRYRVRKSDLDAFLAARAVVPAAKPERQQRRDSAIPRYV